MILKKDGHWRYSRQLTNFECDVEELKALEDFRKDPYVHCVVRKNSDGQYAVFVQPILRGYTLSEQAKENVKLAQERQRLEHDEECVVIDLDQIEE